MTRSGIAAQLVSLGKTAAGVEAFEAPQEMPLRAGHEEARAIERLISSHVEDSDLEHRKT